MDNNIIHVENLSLVTRIDDLGMWVKHENPVASSNMIAERFEKRHDNVLVDIEALICNMDRIFNHLTSQVSKNTELSSQVSQNNKINYLKNAEARKERLKEIFGRKKSVVINAGSLDFVIYKNFYIDESGKKNKQYLLTRDAFLFLVFRYKGDLSLKLQTIYMSQYHEYQKIISKRIGTKTPRKELTATISALGVKDGAGSPAYSYITKTVYQCAGILDRYNAHKKKGDSTSFRDTLEGQELNKIIKLEREATMLLEYEENAIIVRQKMLKKHLGHTDGYINQGGE